MHMHMRFLRDKIDGNKTLALIEVLQSVDGEITSINNLTAGISRIGNPVIIAHKSPYGLIIAEAMWCYNKHGEVCHASREYLTEIADVVELFGRKLHKRLLDAAYDESPYIFSGVIDIGESSKGFREIKGVSYDADNNYYNVIIATYKSGEIMPCASWSLSPKVVKDRTPHGKRPSSQELRNRAWNKLFNQGW